MQYRVQARWVWWRWVVPAFLLGIAQVGFSINGSATNLIESIGALLGAALLPVGGVLILMQRERMYPPITITDAELTVTNHQMVFAIAWSDIDRARSTRRGDTWRLYHHSRPHFTPVVVKAGWYDAGLADAIAARLAAA